MISPTGKELRNDSEGCGYYGAKREGNRRHKGTDYLATPGQTIIAPFDLVLKRYSRPTKNFPQNSGILWQTPKGQGKMFYFTPYEKLIGTYVPQGTEIGVALDLTPFYGSEMLSHIHFQIDSLDPELIRSLSTIIDLGM